MKKILNILVILAFGLSLQAQKLSHQNQVLTFNAQMLVNTEAGGYTTEYQAVLDAWTTDPEGDTLTWQNTLTDSLTTYGGGSNGYWGRMDLLYIFSHTESADGEHLTNWIDPDSVATAVSGPTHGLGGFTGNGTDQYIDTKYALSSDVSNFTQNDATFGVYIRNNIQDDGQPLGINHGSGAIEFYPRYTDNTANYKINDGTYTTHSSITESRGLHIATRTSSTTTELYLDGTSVGTGSQTSASISAGHLYILCANGDGSGIPNQFSENQVSIVFIMDGVTDAEAAQLNRFFETYMDNIGQGVQ